MGKRVSISRPCSVANGTGAKFASARTHVARVHTHTHTRARYQRAAEAAAASVVISFQFRRFVFRKYTFSIGCAIKKKKRRVSCRLRCACAWSWFWTLCRWHDDAWRWHAFTICSGRSFFDGIFRTRAKFLNEKPKTILNYFRRHYRSAKVLAINLTFIREMSTGSDRHRI